MRSIGSGHSGSQKLTSVSSENDVISKAWKPSRFQPYQKAADREGPRRIREEKREAHLFRKSQIQEFLTTVIYIYIYMGGRISRRPYFSALCTNEGLHV